jgi:hypothetical protein
VSEFRSPELPYRVGLLAVLSVVASIAAVRSGGGAEGIVSGVAALGLALAAWRASQAKVVVTGTAFSDVRMFVKRSYDRLQVASMSVGRPGGLRDGFWLILTLKTGQDVPLVASRVYSLVPIGQHVDRPQCRSADMDSSRNMPVLTVRRSSLRGRGKMSER